MSEELNMFGRALFGANRDESEPEPANKPASSESNLDQIRARLTPEVLNLLGLVKKTTATDRIINALKADNKSCITFADVRKVDDNHITFDLAVNYASLSMKLAGNSSIFAQVFTALISKCESETNNLTIIANITDEDLHLNSHTKMRLELMSRVTKVLCGLDLDFIPESTKLKIVLSQHDPNMPTKINCNLFITE